MHVSYCNILICTNYNSYIQFNIICNWFPHIHWISAYVSYNAYHEWNYYMGAHEQAENQLS